MSALVIEEAFVADVDLIAEDCAGCGLPLCLSDEQVGTLADVDGGMPVARLWHLTCAPDAVQAVHDG